MITADKKGVCMFFVIAAIFISCSSSVLSASGFTFNLSGDEGISGFRARSDRTVIDVVAFNTGDEITPEQLSAVIDGTTVPAFTACLDLENGFFNCGYESSYDAVISGSISVAVTLHDDTGNALGSSQTKTLNVDDRAPVPSGITVTQSVSEGTRLAYSVTDTAPSSGIEKIEIREDGIVIYSVTENLADSKSETISVKSSARNTANRTYEVTAIDRMGNIGRSSVNKETDYTKPSVKDKSMNILKNGRMISTLQEGAATPVTINATIIEDKSLSSVKADLSVLGSADGVEGLCNVISEQDAVQKLYGCVWSNVNAKIVDSSQRNVLVKFTLVDENGNINTDAENYLLSAEKSAPQLVSGSFKMLVNNAEVHELAKQNAKVSFTAQFREDYPGMISDQVKLDLTNIGGTQASADSCIFNSSSERYTCTWEATIAVPKKASSVKLEASDLYGNTVSQNVPYSFGVDDTSPSVEYLGTEASVIEGMNVSFGSFAKTGANKIIVRISEKDSGITKENVKLTGSSLSNTNPDSCVQSKKGEWLCVWETVQITGADGTIHEFEVSLSDNAENLVSKKSKVYLDNKKPIILDVSIFSVVEEGLVEYHKTGDVLLVSATVIDIAPVKIFLDMEDLGILENISAACIPQENPDKDVAINWSCEARSRQGIGVIGPTREDVDMLVSDAAGNEKSIKDDINCNSGECLGQSKVIGAFVSENNVKFNYLKVDISDVDVKNIEPDFWSIGSVTTSPKELSRETFELLNARQYFKFNLLSKAGTQASILDLTLLENTCKAKDAEGLAPFDIVSSVSLQNNKGPDKTSPYLFVEYERAKAEYNSFEFTCTVSILTQLQRGSKKTLVRVPEFENVTFKTGFFELPIDTMDAKLSRDIQDIEDDVFGRTGKNIQTLQEVIDIAKGLCTLFGTYQTIAEVWNGIMGADEGWRHVVPPLTEASAQGHCLASTSTSKAFREGWRSYANTFCDYVSCRKTLSDLGYSPSAILSNKLGDTKIGKLTSTVSGKGIADAVNAKPDPSKSIVIATMQGCLPGIVAGLQRHREIKCMYGYCLLNQVAEGTPRALCESQKGAMQCKYVVGEMMHILPWNWVIDSISNNLKAYIQNPLAAVGAAVGFLCPTICGYSSIGASLCSKIDFLKVGSKLVADIKNIGIIEGGDKFKGTFKSSGENYCNKFEEELKK